MSTTYNHIRMSTIDSNNNISILYPESTSSDILVSRVNNTNIPNNVSNIQLLANSLANSAFNNIINDNTTSSNYTWSSYKINERVNNINFYVDSNDNKLHFTNSDNEDSIINYTSGSGTATADKVLQGYTFSNSNGVNIPGTMLNQGTKEYTINPGNTQVIPEGYHNGLGSVSVNSITKDNTYTMLDSEYNNTIDMGINNTYRYINATNVYNKGISDGAIIHTGTYSVGGEGTFDMGSIHTYRYVSVSKFSPASLGDTLEDSSWESIAYHAYIGDLSSYFNIGDTKTLTLNATDDGLISSQTLTMELADFNHDSNTGTVDFVCKNCMKETHKITYSLQGSSSRSYWGYACSNMRAYLNGPVFNSIPTECSDYIIDKTVETYVNGYINRYGTGVMDMYGVKLHTTMNKLWLLTAKEVGVSYSPYSGELDSTTHSQYPIFTDNASRKRGYDGSDKYWWLASSCYASNYVSSWSHMCVSSAGEGYASSDTYDSDNSYSRPNGSWYVVFGFRL